jgi:polyferredoxin
VAIVTIDWHPDARHLRRWGVVTAIALGVAGALFRFVDWGVFAAARPVAPYLWGFGAFALVTAGTGTRAGLPAYWAWMAFTWTVGTTLGTAALGAVFYGVVTPMGVVARILGRDRLELRTGPGTRSMWRAIPERRHDPQRQF